MLITQEVERFRREGTEDPWHFPSLRRLALECIEAQRERPTAFPEYERPYALDQQFAALARHARGKPFTDAAWTKLRERQGMYLNHRGLLVEAEREYKAARDEEHLREVRKRRRDGEYGLTPNWGSGEEPGQRVWRSGTALAVRCRLP